MNRQTQFITGKKSQITIFLLLGIIMLFAFGFLYFMGQLNAEEIQKNLKTASRNTQETSAIKYYVYSCLDKASKDGLMKIGNQGGFIHKYQEGTIFNWQVPYVEYTRDNMAYNVSFLLFSDTSGNIEPINTHKRNDPEPITPENPSDPGGSLHNYYPCEQGYTDPPPPNNGFYDEIMGDTCLHLYEHTQSSIHNKLNFGIKTRESNSTRGVIPDLCKMTYDTGLYKCACTTAHCNYSIQSQLEEYIKYHTMECLTFSEYEGYNVTYGNPDVNITFNIKDTEVIFNLPITIKWKGGLPMTEIERFHSIYKVRMKYIYSLVFGGWVEFGNMISKQFPGIINKEMKIDYDILQDSTDYLNQIGGIEIKKFPISTNVTIIQLNDTESRIGTTPYIFQFAIQNRKPALDYYDKDNSLYDVVVPEDGTINLTPVGYDPDEDTLQYRYRGWKVDWDDEFNESGYVMTTTPYTTNVWQTSNPYILGCDYDGLGPMPFRCAEYTTNRKDVGPHNVTISVIDEAGEKDWQTVSILVDDKPKISVDLENYYADIPDNHYASIEDNYKIDVSSTTDFYGTGPIEFLWRDLNFPNQLKISFSTFPSENNYVHEFPSPYADITSIKTAPYVLNKGTHNLQVIAQKGMAVASKDFTVYAEECLPHRSFAAPFPFNIGLTSSQQNSVSYSTESDPFQADHTCCDTDFTRFTQADAVPCFQLIDYGPIIDGGSRSLLDTDLELITADVYTSKPPTPPSPLSDEDYFDVWKREYTVYCDGNSGNTCIPQGGNEIHKYVWDTECPDAALDEECVVAEYGKTARCKNIPQGSHADFGSHKVLAGYCNSNFQCSITGVGQTISDIDSCDSTDPNCRKCLVTCDGNGHCNRNMWCKNCPNSCQEDASHTVPAGGCS